MKKFICLLLLLGICFEINAQTNWGEFETIRSQGSIPKDFTEAFSRKLKKESRRIDENESRRNRRRQEDFYTKSEFFIDRMLTSGDVVFGDTITRYCEAILDRLLKDEPELRKELRVYLVKSPEVNAAATSSGIILVNVGLMAQVENEAQLAYVLAHEVIHYQKEHVVDQYVRERELEEERFLGNSADYDLQDLSKYSRSLELEADELGFNYYYLKSGYHPIQAYLIMDVLMYSYLPFDEIPLEKSYFDFAGAKMPEDYFLTKTAAITAEEDFDDENLSHPNIRKRKEAIYEKLRAEDEGAEYLLGRDWFEHCQRLSRYETIRIRLERRNYPEALVNIYLAEKIYGSDRYLDLSKVKAWHGLAGYYAADDVSEVLTYYENVEGESQQWYYLLDQISGEAVIAYATAYAYDFLRRYQVSDYAYQALEKNIQWLLAQDLRLEDFETDGLDQAERLEAEAAKRALLDSLLASRNRSSKIERIEKNKIEEDTIQAFYTRLFTDFMSEDDTLFRNLFKRVQAKYTDWEERREDEEVVYTANRYYGQKFDDNAHLNIDRLLAVAPYYLNIQSFNETEIRYFRTWEGQRRLVEIYEEMAQLNDIDLAMLSHKSLTADETELFNELIVLQAWLFERLNHGDRAVMVSAHDLLQPILDKYGTDYLNTSAFYTYRRPNNAANKMCLGILLPPLLPIFLVDAFTPEYDSYHYFYVVNGRTGDPLLLENLEFNNPDRKDYLQSILYNNFLQVKSKAN